MCYRPLKIDNNTLHFSLDNSARYMYCNCGKCLTCRAIRQRDWYIRAYGEWRQCVDANGLFTYYTLTFDDEHVPSSFGHLHFSRRIVQLFIKRCAKQLSKNGATLRYMIVSEFGDLFQRPHHHALFGLYNSNMTPLQFRRFLEKNWQQGFVVPGDKLGVVDSPSALNYVTKYVTKDVGFVTHPFVVRSLLPIVREYIKECGFTHSSIRSFIHDAHVSMSHDEKCLQYSYYLRGRREIEKYIPFVTASNNFGASLLSKINYDDETITLPVGKSLKKMTLPLYLFRKAYYERVPNERDGKLTKYQLSPKGVRHFVETISQKIEDTATNLFTFYSSYIPTYEDVKLLELHYPQFFTSVESLHAFMRNFNLPPRYVSIYKHIFRGRSTHLLSSFFKIDNSDFLAILDKWKHFYFRYMTSRPSLSDVPLKEHTKYYQRFIDESLFDRTPLFATCEMYFTVYEIINSRLQQANALAIYKKQQEQREIRQRAKLARYNSKFHLKIKQQ